MKHFVSLFICFLSLTSSIAPSLAAKPFVQPLFSDHMVLQRDNEDAVWGWTNPGDIVIVKVMDATGATVQTRAAAANTEGLWQVLVGPFGLVPNNASYSMEIAGPNNTPHVKISDILIGDVWLCTGQSNMEYTLFGNYPEPGTGGTRLANSTGEIADAAAHYPFIRHFKVSHGTVAATPQDTFIGGVDNGGWTTNANARAFTAVGFFMAKEIYDAKHVPIGLLNITWGGTDIPPWVAPESLRTIPDYASKMDSLGSSPNQTTPTAIYNAMVAPAAGFGLKGAVWLQGESSVRRQTEQSYGALLAALRDGLRMKFANPTLPFIIVQICTAGPAQTVPVEDTANKAYLHYPEIRDAQLTVGMADVNSRVVASLDCGYVPNPSGAFMAEVHNINKQSEGKRVGQAALNLAYGVTTAYLSPVFDHMVVSGSTLRCFFKYAGPGLMTGQMPGGLSQDAPPAPSPVKKTNDAPVTGFAIAGLDGIFYDATATLDPSNDTVVLSSPGVPSPAAVRYGWATNPWNTTTNSSNLNLYRKVIDDSGNVVDGVQVLPFRTDPVSP
jgi:sialate O-acetylesterase